MHWVDRMVDQMVSGSRYHRFSPYQPTLDIFSPATYIVSYRREQYAFNGKHTI